MPRTYPSLPVYLVLLALGFFAECQLSAHETEAGLHHWEIASKDPDRIFLSFHGDPATSRAVTWRTDTTIEQARAQIAVATGNPKFDREAMTLEAATERVELSLHKANKQAFVHYHSVVFEDLLPDTLYAYRVGSRGHWSEWIQFRTAKTELAPFSFVYFGDAQNEILGKWSRNIRMSYTVAPEAAFAIHAGDLVDNGHMDTQWAEWFKAGGWIHSQRTGIPVVGNHEYRPIPGVSKEKLISMVWRPQFTLPEDPSLPEALQETVYTVDYQGLRVIVLNCIDDIETQAKYLRQQLKRPGAKWTVVTSHYSIFTPNKKRGLQQSTKLWLPIIEEFSVDLVLQGHDHAYLRGHQPVRFASGEAGDSLQTMFVTSMSGAKQYDIAHERVETYARMNYSPDKKGVQKQFFQVIEVNGLELTYSAYTADGVLFDRAVITKDPETGLKHLQNH
ncbi:MAG: fibronectin type III domain-containing protein [Puniceicoccaceae bacterium]